MGCPGCGCIVNIMPPHDYVLVDVETSKKENIRFGVYHVDCYEKAKARARVGVVCDDLATCKVPE